jgi:hypothetical protein
MSHKRTDIRNALKTILLGTAPSYATDAEDRVYTNRTYNVQKSKLPAIIIHDETEIAIYLDMRTARLNRKVTMNVTALVTASSDYDTELDDLCKQVEDTINSNRFLNGTCIGTLLQKTDFLFEAGEKTIGQATLTYEIQYIS